MIVEPITTADVEHVAELHAQAFADFWSAREISALICGPGAFGLLAREAGGIAGFILCRTIADEAEILTLATAPVRRRCGVASGLTQAASSHVAGRGALRLFLEVAEDNLAAIALYRRLGFARVGVRLGYYSRPGGAISALVMRRELNR